jgi:hypothetical protein
VDPAGQENDASHDSLQFRLPYCFALNMPVKLSKLQNTLFSCFVKHFWAGSPTPPPPSPVPQALWAAARKLKSLPRELHYDWTKNRGKVNTTRRLQFFQDQEGVGERPQRRSCLVPGPITGILPTIGTVLP